MIEVERQIDFLAREYRCGKIWIKFNYVERDMETVAISITLSTMNYKPLLRHAINYSVRNGNYSKSYLIQERCLWLLVHVSQFVNWEKGKLRRIKLFMAKARKFF